MKPNERGTSERSNWAAIAEELGVQSSQDDDPAITTGNVHSDLAETVANPTSQPTYHEAVEQKHRTARAWPGRPTSEFLAEIDADSLLDGSLDSDGKYNTLQWLLYDLREQTTHRDYTLITALYLARKEEGGVSPERFNDIFKDVVTPSNITIKIHDKEPAAPVQIGVWEEMTAQELVSSVGERCDGLRGNSKFIALMKKLQEEDRSTLSLEDKLKISFHSINAAIDERGGDPNRVPFHVLIGKLQKLADLDIDNPVELTLLDEEPPTIGIYPNMRTTDFLRIVAEHSGLYAHTGNSPFELCLHNLTEGSRRGKHEIGEAMGYHQGLAGGWLSVPNVCSILNSIAPPTLRFAVSNEKPVVGPESPEESRAASSQFKRSVKERATGCRRGLRT